MGITRVLIAEENPVVRRNVRALLENEPGIEITGEAGSVAQMLAGLNQARADVVLLNAAVGDGGTPGLLRRLKALYPGLRIMAASMADGCQYFFEVPPAGASSYIISAAGPDELVAALRGAREGQPATRDSVARGGNGHVRLTPRERQVAELVTQGCANGEIAARLSLKPSTVRTHRANVTAKLGLPSRTDLVKHALSSLTRVSP